VRPHHKEDGFPLGRWVTGQRARSRMSKARRKKLNELGFVWNPREGDWENGFGLLQQYKKREGHSRVTREHKESGFALGIWASNQRKQKDKLSKEKRDRLDELGFVWEIRRLDAG
jgi:Helicase associated domain